ncbi:hypothetical protein [Arthrobacter monumenti]
MSNPMNAATYVLDELRAREAWTKRNYDLAFESAKNAAETALETGDSAAWWNLTYLQAECLREKYAYDECVVLAQHLLEHPLASQFQLLAVRASTMLAVALQGLDRLPEAREAAAGAVENAAADDQAGGLKVEAQHAYIASLAESGELDEAWLQCLELDTAVTNQVDDQTCGKAYWVIGNVAFLRQQVSEGLRYHSLAAKKLSPTNDVDLWAKFNKASAAMRLSADILEPETLECIERAELAAEIVGASTSELLQLSATRAHWLYSTGDVTAAIELLRPICEQRSLLYAQTAGDALLLLGKSLLAQGDQMEALSYLNMAADQFTSAGAQEKAALTLALIEGLPRKDVP